MSNHSISGEGVIAVILTEWVYIQKFLPETDHFFQAVITAAACGVATYFSTVFAKWCWGKLGFIYSEITIRITSKKKGFSLFNFFNKKK